jgi:CheY-like chemotaxis protein
VLTEVDIVGDLPSIGTAMTRKWRILLVDDDEDYRQVFARALKESGLNVDLFEATDGFAAINYLVGNEPYADRERFPFPDLAFVDLKMPGMDGLEVLKEIRTRLGLQNLPIIILTTSELPADVAASYSCRASAFHQKPPWYQDLVRLLRTVVPLWINVGSSPEIQRDVRISPFRH